MKDSRFKGFSIAKSPLSLIGPLAFYPIKLLLRYAWFLHDYLDVYSKAFANGKCCYGYSATIIYHILLQNGVWRFKMAIGLFLFCIRHVVSTFAFQYGCSPSSVSQILYFSGLCSSSNNVYSSFYQWMSSSVQPRRFLFSIFFIE